MIFDEKSYKELVYFVMLYLTKKSRKWLIDHQFAHLLATIEGIEGKETALTWLKKWV